MLCVFWLNQKAIKINEWRVPVSYVSFPVQLCWGAGWKNFMYKNFMVRTFSPSGGCLEN